jgi:hypothetical protein
VRKRSHPKDIHHRDAEFAEGLFKMISSFEFLRALRASAVNNPG